MSDVATQAVKAAKEKAVTVHFRHIGELEKVDFRVDLDTTLQAAWDAAYRELGIGRDERDTLQAAAGSASVDLTPHLGRTLRELRDENLIKNFQFEIAAGTGGA